MFTPGYERHRSVVYILPPTPPLADILVAEEVKPLTAWECFVKNLTEACSCCLGVRPR